MGIRNKPSKPVSRWTPEQELDMTADFEKTRFGNLTDVKELFSDLYDYGQLRLSRAVHGQIPRL